IVLESGSLERDDEMHVMAYAIAGKHGVFRESNKPFSVMKICTNTQPERRKNRMGGVDYQHLVETTLMDPRRNRIILDLVAANLNFKILILTALREYTMLIHNIAIVVVVVCISVISIVIDYMLYRSNWYKMRKCYLTRRVTITDYNVVNYE